MPRKCAESPRIPGAARVPRPLRERQILVAAVEQFGLRGYAAASVADIATQVGVTKTLVHHYFGSKRDLQRACVAWADGELLAGLDATVDGVAVGAEPATVLRGFFAALDGRRPTWLLLADVLHRRAGGPAPTVARFRTPAAVASIASACTAGTLRTPAGEDPREADALEQGWWGMVTGLVHWWVGHPEQTADSMAERCARLLAVTGPTA